MEIKNKVVIQPNEAYNLRLTGLDLILIQESLVDRPYKIAAPLIEKITEQVQKIEFKEQ